MANFTPTQTNIDQGLLKRAVWHASKIFLLLRISTLIWVGVLSSFAKQLIVLPNILLCPPSTLSESSNNAGIFLASWVRWDTTCYISIAELGYQANLTTTVWPPVYPMLIRLFMFITPPSILAALLISSLATWLAFLVLYLLISTEHNEKTARNTITLMAIFPVSFFLVAGYTESLFIALACGSLLCARRQHWCWAGLLAAGATLTRNQGLVLPLVFLWEAFQQNREQSDKHLKNLFQIIVACSLPIFAFGAFAIYVRFVLGADWPWQTLSSYWDQHWGFPWQGIIGNTARLAALTSFDRFFWVPSTILDLIFAILAPLILAFNRRGTRSTFMIFAWLLLLTSLMKLGGGDILISFSRYLIPVFPFFLILSPLVEKRKVWLGIFAIGLTLQGFLLAMFYIWSWVG